MIKEGEEEVAKSYHSIGALNFGTVATKHVKRMEAHAVPAEYYTSGCRSSMAKVAQQRATYHK